MKELEDTFITLLISPLSMSRKPEQNLFFHSFVFVVYFVDACDVTLFTPMSGQAKLASKLS